MQPPKLTQITDDIIALDKANMAPLLANNGHQFNETFVRKDIARFHPGLKNVICCYKQQVLQGYFRFSIDSNGQILVRSLQLKQTAPKRTLLQLLFLACSLLQADGLPDHTAIYAIANNFNMRSICFQQKLGFKFDAGDQHYCRYKTTKAALTEQLIQRNMGRFSKATPAFSTGQEPLPALTESFL